jgi:hypothetical protein
MRRCPRSGDSSSAQAELALGTQDALCAAVRSFVLGLTLLATAASAQQQLDEQSVWERCYGVPIQPVAPSVYYGFSGQGALATPEGPPGHVTPAPLSGNGSSGSLGSGGGGSPEGLLVLAVVLAVALPVVIYAVDSEAPEPVLRRFGCPTFSFEGWGGVEGSSRSSNWAGLAVGRFRAGYGFLGTDFQFDASPAGVGSYSVHLLLRPKPKEHLEGGLALGYKRSYFAAQLREGLEIGLPHQYVLWRDDRRQLGIELRPGVFFTRSGVDLSVELALMIPLFDFLSARVGTRAFSFDGQTMLGFSAGLSLHL